MNEWANQRMDEWKKGSFENEISGNSILVDMHISQTWSNVIQNHWLCNTQEKKCAEQESCCNSDIHLEMIIISVRLWKYKQRYVRNSTLKTDSCQTNERTSQNVLFNFPINVCGTRWFWLGILANNSSKCIRCYCYERSLTFAWCFHYFFFVANDQKDGDSFHFYFHFVNIGFISQSQNLAFSHIHSQKITQYADSIQ